MTKIRERVWIDGELKTIEREMTYEEEEASLRAYKAEKEWLIEQRAYAIAKENGRNSPNASDWQEARSAQDRGFHIVTGIVVVMAIILLCLFFYYFIMPIS